MLPMTEDQNRLRTTFDGAALLYDQVRPGYPEELFDDMVALSRLPPGGRVLEIGCGTGQATVPLARRGYRVLCVELGENLATVARRNLLPYSRAEVQTGDFEEYPLQEGAFDLAASATAFHWLDPAVAYPKVARALRPGGSSPSSGTSTSTATRAGASSRPRRRSTSARRRRSSSPTTTRGCPVPKTSRTGPKGSRPPACSPGWSGATTGGTSRTMRRATSAS
jgi:ubiquinone/menaquinone biosynthesis C-methylase UbiE